VHLAIAGKTLILRSWNLFHGNAYPSRRQGFLRAMLEMINAGKVDIICLQELPVWSLSHLEAWTGMTCVAGVARPPVWPAALSAWITRLHQGLFRSTFSGQANAILVGNNYSVKNLGHRQISDPARERRICQPVRVEGRIIVANLHATNEFRHPEIPCAELGRARDFAEQLAGPNDCVALAGDFNLHSPWLDGYSPPGPGIDHVLVRGATPTPLEAWPVDRRTHHGVVLSDHAPVDLRI
jgi:endonuclease/exonuclease/phosphatase family metal-dependent hydrolase